MSSRLPVPAFVASILLSILALPPLSAADPASLKHYGLGVADGLASDSVYCIYQDSLGFMWFGTFGGLSRYDGESFETWRPRGTPGSLQASVVFAVAEDGKGRLWVGTDGGGLARFDRDSGGFTVYRADPARADALSSDRVLSLGKDARGRLWVGTGDGTLTVVDPDGDRLSRVVPPSAPAPVRCIAADAEGGVWAGTEGGGLLHVDAAGCISSWRHDASRLDSLGANVVRSVLVDRSGRVWLGLGDGGIDLFDAGAFRHAWPGKGANLPEEAVRALAEDPEGEIWIGWADSGLGRLSPETLEVTAPLPGSGGMVRSLFRDRGGLMWAGFKDGGTRTYNIDSAHFQRFMRLADGTPIRQARGMAELPDGRVLVGTDGQGVIVLDRATGLARSLPGMPTSRPSLKVYSLLAGRDGSLWAGTDGAGLIRKRPGGSLETFRSIPGDASSLSSNVVWSLLEDVDGRIWVGTEGGGLDRLDPSSGAIEHFRHDAADPGSIRGSSIRSLYRDRKGRLWIGTWDGGLSRLDPGARSFVNYLPHPEGQGNSLADASVNCVLEDDEGTIWIGTGGSGLARLDEASGEFRIFDSASGLAGDTVYGLLDDHHGLLWVATATGLSSFDRGTGAISSYGEEDGLVSGIISQNACLASRDGSIWIGGPEGVARFLSAEAARGTIPPIVAITSLESPDGSRLRRSADGTTIELPWRNAGLRFRIAVLDYSAPTRNRYAIKLEGRQTAWTDLGYSNAGAIAQLPPGKYVLRAKGANGNGAWNEEGSSLSIVVAHPFWQVLWFRITASAVLALLVLGVVAWRTRSLRARNELLVNLARHVERAREEERTDAARDVHDEIGQQLTILNLQAWWLRNHPDAGAGERTSRLEVMQGSIGQALASVKSVATRLRPIALDALSFPEAARWYARDFGRRSGINCEVRSAERIPALTDEEATALFRVLQEALANVARHSAAHNAWITISSTEEWILLEVSDDGGGMDPARAEAPDSFGIIGMRERCAGFGGGLDVRSAPGRGTTVTARVPAGRKGKDQC